MSDVSGNRLMNWVLTVLGSLLTIAVSGAIVLGFSLQASVNVLSTQFAALKDTLIDKTSDRYTGSEAARDRGFLQSQILDQSERVKKLEGIVRDLELDKARREGRSEMRPSLNMDNLATQPKGG